MLNILLIVETGANVDIVDKKGFTPLITATQFGHVALVAYLVGRGARLECEDLNGDNALHWV